MYFDGIIMEKDLQMPEGVNLDVDKKTIKVSGEKGSLERKFKYFYDNSRYEFVSLIKKTRTRRIWHRPYDQRWQ